MAKQSKSPNDYTKVGRITMTVARAAHIKAADIYVSPNQLRHIERRHGKEIGSCGLSALGFVENVCKRFNQIRMGSDNSLLLVVYVERLSRVAAITLNYSLKDEFWEIKTAEPRESSAVMKKTLIWPEAHPDGGNGNRLN